MWVYLGHLATQFVSVIRNTVSSQLPVWARILTLFQTISVPSYQNWSWVRTESNTSVTCNIMQGNVYMYVHLSSTNSLPINNDVYSQCRIGYKILAHSQADNKV